MKRYGKHIPYTELAERFGTPLYVYSAAALDEAVETYHRAFLGQDILICYAVKANSNLSILRRFVRQGCGFDIVSGGELARVLAAGGDASKTVFSGVGKSESEIRYALQVGIKCFNVESLLELERINTVAGELGVYAPVSLRINPDVDAQTHPYISTGLKDNKFGIPMQQAKTAYAYAVELPHLKVVGIDCHIGSQLLNLEPMIEACERLLPLIDYLLAQGVVLEHIDLGGGVGIVYEEGDKKPDVVKYATTISHLLAGYGVQLIIEPGRSLVGQAGVLLTKVEYLKHGEGKNFVIVDAAMNDLIRPTLYGAYHHIENVSSVERVQICADIVGPICETGDFLAQNRCIAADMGDVLAVYGAGAYAATMASNYNTRGRAAEVLVDGNEVMLIRHRETIEDLLKNELSCLT